MVGESGSGEAVAAIVTGRAPERAAERLGERSLVVAFGAWVGATGKALVDPGAPLGPSKTVSAGSVTEGRAPGPFNGYSILDAADLDGAVDLVRSHPYVERGGSLQVSEAVAP